MLTQVATPMRTDSHGVAPASDLSSLIMCAWPAWLAGVGVPDKSRTLAP